MTASGDPESTDDTTLTAGDIGDLNRQMVLRAAVFARMTGTVLVVAGVVGLLAWAWLAVRHQQTVDDFGAAFRPTEPTSEEISGFLGGMAEVSFPERLDLLASEISLAVTALLAVGLGIGLRLVADYCVARTGGTLTGYRPGDRV